MIAVLRRAIAALRGTETPDGSVPVMDGPLRPNSHLDAAALRLSLSDVDNLLAADERLFCTQGAHLVTLLPGPVGDLVVGNRQRLAAEIGCLAASPDGTVAVGLDQHGVLLHGGPRDGTMLTIPGLNAPTAATFVGPDTLVVTHGSALHPAAEWRRDLMSKGASGSVWRFGLADGSAIPLATGLAFPNGIAVDGRGTTLFLSESWRHRVLRLETARPGAPTVVLDDLPAYPGRIVPALCGGFWMALFAPRNPLVEFVLSEPLYCRRMMQRIDPDHWIAPALASGRSVLEPLQGGARKTMNQLKPWSPSWSYGLVVRFDAVFVPVESFHSRADDHVHGVTALCDLGDRVLVAARGAGRIVELAR